MRVRLAYGESGLDVDLPDDRTTVIVAVASARRRRTRPPRSCGALRDPVAGPPLRELVRRGQTVAISICDGTRAAAAARLMIPAVLDELDGIVDLDDVVVLVATGTHRGNTDAELRAMLGDEVVDAVRIVNHDARDDATLVVGRPARRGRAGLAEPRVGRGRRPDHDRLRRAALLRRLLRRPEDGRSGPGRAGDGADAARRRADRPPATRAGASSRAIPSTTTCARSRPRTGVDFALDVVARRASSGIVQAFGGELIADAPRRLRRREGDRDAAGRRAVRRRRHDELRLPARPEPLPGGEGHVRRRPGGEAGRDDRLRGRVPRRLPRPRLVPRGADLGAVAAGAARRDRRARARPCPTSGRSRSRPRSRPARGSSCTRRTSPTPTSRAAHLEQTDDIAATVEEALAAAGPDARVCVLPEGPQTIPYVVPPPASRGHPGGGAAEPARAARKTVHRNPVESQSTASKEPVASRTAPSRNGEVAPIVYPSPSIIATSAPTRAGVRSKSSGNVMTSVKRPP